MRLIDDVLIIRVVIRVRNLETGLETKKPVRTTLVCIV